MHLPVWYTFHNGSLLRRLWAILIFSQVWETTTTLKLSAASPFPPFLFQLPSSALVSRLFSATVVCSRFAPFIYLMCLQTTDSRQPTHKPSFSQGICISLCGYFYRIAYKLRSGIVPTFPVPVQGSTTGQWRDRAFPWPPGREGS